MFCKNCGAQINDKAVICVHCGAQICSRIIPTFSSFDKWGISKSEVTLPCRLSPEEVDDRMCNLSRYGILFNLVGRNVFSDGFEYSLTVNIGLCSWGELMYVKCTKTNEGSMVNIFSKCAFPLQICAWGKHDRNIAKIESALGIS